jgi:hypothetical protein
MGSPEPISSIMLRLPVDSWRTLSGMRDLQFNLLSIRIGATIQNGQVTVGGTTGPVAGARASVDTSGDIERRITATRLVLTGPFALAFRKKKDRRALWLTIDGDGFQAVTEVSPKREAEARRWAAEFNTRAMNEK